MPANYFGFRSSATGGKQQNVKEIAAQVEQLLIEANHDDVEGITKMTKLWRPFGSRILLSTDAGQAIESVLTVDDINGKVSKIHSPTGDKVVVSSSDGEIKESRITLTGLSSIKVKEVMDIPSFVDGKSHLLKLDKRVNFTTSFHALFFDSKIKMEKEKKLKFVASDDKVNYDVIKEWTMEPGQKDKQFVADFVLQRGKFYNFVMEIDGVTNLGDVFDYIRLEWYTAEG